MVDPALLILGCLAALSALGVPLLRNPIYSALSLILVLFFLACIYGLIGAHFIAAVQLIVYAGAIMVLFIFAVMLLNMNQPETGFSLKQPKVIGACVLVGVLFAFMARTFILSPTTVSKPGIFTPEMIVRSGGNVKVASQALFVSYGLHFLAIAVLILSAMIGAVVLAKRKQDL